VTATLWTVVTIFATALVCYGFGPIFQQRDQLTLMSEYRTDVYDASVAVAAPGSQSVAPLPPAPGTPVGILEIGAIRLQQVVVEGVGPAQTEEGPGHVPGTASLGQPGNAVVVARRAAFGGPFARLGSLKRGEEILVTTTQGQSVYRVRDVASTTLYSGRAAPATTGAGGVTDVSTAPTGPSGTAPAQVPAAVSVDELYGLSADNRLTLVSSGSDVPWNSTRAVVVVAEMVGPPFAPTPQGSRSDALTGANGSSSAMAPLVLVLLAYTAVALAAIAAYRRYSPRAAWFLTTPPLVVLTVLLAEIGSQLMPAWL
jgi:sortase A